MGEATDTQSGALSAELVALHPPAGRGRVPGRLSDQDPNLPGLEPDRTTTDWGRSERLAALADATVADFLYHYWLRVETEGVENVPASGGALLVANRAGQLPLDGAMIARAVREEHPAARQLQVAYDRTFASLPGLGVTLRKLGAVRAHPANLHRLLFDEGRPVLVFPEGSQGPRKPLKARYRLRSFEHHGYVEAAMRAGVPIVPVAVLGAEEATPLVTSLAPLGRRLRLPVGLLLPLPAKFRLRFLQPIRTDDLGPAPWRDRGRLEESSEEIRRLIQENLFEMVGQRRSVWLG